jgi:hypothetical protein
MNFAQALLYKGVRFRESGDGRTHLNCPFCPERGKPADTQLRLCVHAVQGWGRCMHCDWKHRWAILPVLRQLGLAPEDLDLDLEGAGPPAEPPEPVVLPEDFMRLTHAIDDLDQQALAYVRKRGVTPEQIRHHKIGVSYVGRYAYRVIFPLYVEGKLCGINARDFTGHQEPKYLLSKGEKHLYNFNPKAHTVILSEGVIKALKIEQVTPACSASLLGHDLTDTQFRQLKASACRHAILYPDPLFLNRPYEMTHPSEFASRKGVLGIADRLAEDWSGKVSLVHPVKRPADDAPLSELKYNLEGRVIEYSAATRMKFLLA